MRGFSTLAFHLRLSVMVAAALVYPWSQNVQAQAKEPIRIGIIAEESAIGGVGIVNGARLAVDAINAAGGVDGRKLEIMQYDDHSSAADAVRAFQRAVSQDKVVAVIGTYISEVALALEPWAARTHVPFITTGAASNEISRHIHEDYDKNKYTFHEYMTSAFIADSICDSVKDLLQKKYSIKSAVVLSEDAAWTTPLDAEYLVCLPKIGVKVLDHIRFSPDTSDFTPLYNKIESEKPDVIVTGISHTGVQPTVQWAQQQVPVPMIGMSSQATAGTFWKDTNGAAAGIVTFSVAADGANLTPNTQPFINDYIKRFGEAPELHRVHHPRCRECPGASHQARRLHGRRQAGCRARADQLCGHHWARAVLRPRQRVHSRHEIRTGIRDRHHDSVAGRRSR